MSTYSVENSARRFQQSFESELPPEVFADLVSRRNIPAPPPVYRPPVVISNPPARPSATPWIVALLSIVLFGIFSTNRNRSLEVSPVRPAPFIPAQPSRAPAPQQQTGTQQMTTMPDGSQVLTTFKGYLSDVSQLPHYGAQLGDMWGVGTNLWVLTTPAGSYRVGWVDPPGDQSEVRRALPVDTVEVRRGKMVVPRAALVQ